MIMAIAQCPCAVADVQRDGCVTGRCPVSRPLPAKKGRKRLLCPTCRTECAVQGWGSPVPSKTVKPPW